MHSLSEIRGRIIQSELLEPAAIDQQIGEWHSLAGGSNDGAALLQWLVDREVLTDFHREALLAGHAGPYKLGPYRVFERVAAGRLGNLFRAVHEEFGQPVSLKVFPAALAKSPEKLARLGRETRVSIEVDHPNVVRAFQVGEIGGTYFLAIEDLRGEPLAARLARDGKLPFPTACRLVREAAIGAEYLHSAGIVHRDLQPGNLWVTAAGALKIMEFGAARDALEFLDATAAGEHPTLNDVIVGTYDYMAPEQAQDSHTADVRSDIYSLGCTLYHCLTGQPPFPDRNPVRQMLRHSNEQPKSVLTLATDVPQSLADTVAIMLAKKPADRYQRAKDVAWQLEQYAELESPAQVEGADTAGRTETSLNPDFLAWVASAEGRAATGFGTFVSSPQCAEFIDWLVDQYGRRE